MPPSRQHLRPCVVDNGGCQISHCTMEDSVEGRGVVEVWDGDLLGGSGIRSADSDFGGSSEITPVT